MSYEEILQRILKVQDCKLDPVRESLAGSGIHSLTVVDIPRNEAYEIYRVRALINADNGGLYCGYDDLLPVLAGWRGKRVTITILSTDTSLFKIFADGETLAILGVVSAEKSRIRSEMASDQDGSISH